LIDNMKHLSSTTDVLFKVEQAWEKTSPEIITKHYEFYITEEEKWVL